MERVNLGDIRVLSDVLATPWRSHESVEDADRILVVRDDTAHVVQNFTSGDDPPHLPSGVWVEVAVCNDPPVAQHLAMLCQSRGG